MKWSIKQVQTASLQVKIDFQVSKEHRVRMMLGML